MILEEVILVTQKNCVFECAPVGGTGVRKVLSSKQLFWWRIAEVKKVILFVFDLFLSNKGLVQDIFAVYEKNLGWFGQSNF